MTCSWTIEDTVKGLEGMILSTKFIEHDFNGIVNIEACEQAIDLLKAQEPRVMTLGEVQKISTEDLDGVVWLESRMNSDPNNGDCDIWFSGWANPVESCETDIHLYAFGNEVPVEAKNRWYGITWRCWTARPTDEQREAVKWE